MPKPCEFPCLLVPACTCVCVCARAGERVFPLSLPSLKVMCQHFDSL